MWWRASLPPAAQLRFKIRLEHAASHLPSVLSVCLRRASVCLSGADRITLFTSSGVSVGVFLVSAGWLLMIPVILSLSLSVNFGEVLEERRRRREVINMLHIDDDNKPFFFGP